MTLKFLPVQTPTSVGILVITRDRYLQSEIEIALTEYENVFYASNATEASGILADDQVGVVVIDASILESDEKTLIAEILSFFPELVLVSLVETGGTHNLAALSEDFNVYRYLKFPCARKQINHCVRSAVKKHMKDQGTTDVEENDEYALLKDLFNLKSVAIAGGTVALLLVAIFIFLNIDNDNISEDDKEIISEAASDTDSDGTFTSAIKEQKTEIISESEETSGQPAVTVEPTEIDIIVNKANTAFQSDNFYSNDNDNAFAYYISALKLQNDHPEALDGFKKVLKLMLNDIRQSTEAGDYQKTIMISNIITQALPNHPVKKSIDKYIDEHANKLIEQARTQASNAEYENANDTLDGAAILLGESNDLIADARNYLETESSQASEQNSEIEELIAIIQQRLDNDNLSKPDNDSAKYHLLVFFGKYPDDERYLELSNQLANKFAQYAEKAIDNNNLPKAKYYIEEIQALDVGKELAQSLITKVKEKEKPQAVAEEEVEVIEVVAIEEPLEKPTEEVATPPVETAIEAQSTTAETDTIQERIEKQEKINSLLIEARKSFNAGNYYTPEQDNAYFYLKLAKEIDADNEDIIFSLNELAESSIKLIQQSISAEQYEEARNLIQQTRGLDLKTDELNQLEQQLQ